MGRDKERERERRKRYKGAGRERKVYYEELAHMIMEAENFLDL